MPDDLPRTEMEKAGGEPPAVTVNLIPAVAWAWRRGWIQTLWRKVAGKRGKRP